jgi:hypothetical protein
MFRRLLALSLVAAVRQTPAQKGAIDFRRVWQMDGRERAGEVEGGLTMDWRWN